MSQAQVLTDATEIILTVIFWVTLLFPLVVGTFWRWWLTSFGNSYIWKVILIAVVTSPTALHEILGVNSGALWFSWYTTLALALIPPVIIWRGWILWREQREGKSLSPVTAVRDWAGSRHASPVQEVTQEHQESCGSAST